MSKKAPAALPRDVLTGRMESAATTDRFPLISTRIGPPPPFISQKHFRWEPYRASTFL
jgi:hypothetical protein